MSRDFQLRLDDILEASLIISGILMQNFGLNPKGNPPALPEDSRSLTFPGLARREGVGNPRDVFSMSKRAKEKEAPR